MTEQYSRVDRMVTIRRRKEDWVKIAENLEEVKNICQEYNCDFYGVQVIPCDPSLRL